MSIKAIGSFFKSNNISKYDPAFFDLKRPINQISTQRRAGKQYNVVVDEFVQDNKKIIHITKYDDSQHPFMTTVCNKIKQYINGQFVASRTDVRYTPSRSIFD